MESVAAGLLGAFPTALRGDVALAIADLPAPLHPPHPGLGTVTLAGEFVRIPSRIYNPELPKEPRARLSERQRLILDWLYTRHHDGHLREASLRRAMPVRELWMAPFLIQLIGEYVVEILFAIEELLTAAQIDILAAFASQNAEFLGLTRARVASYWDCYYRGRFPRLADYVGSQLLRRIDERARIHVEATA